MSAKNPNFLIIVADDLGYTDISPLASEIPTPTLARLAATGTLLTNFHTASACSPTRSMLLTGTDHHIAGLGQMAEHMGRREEYVGRRGYEGYLNENVAAISEILKEAGYETMISGKWHLGLTPETAPAARGFTKTLTFLSGCHNHFLYEPQLTDPSHALFTPMAASRFWMKDTEYIDPTTELPQDFYSTDFFADNLVHQLETRDTEKPFFAYLPFTAPHWPLQAPRHLIDKYKGLYNDGPAVLRARRLAKLKDLGIISADINPAPMTSDSWDSLSPLEKQKSSRNMEIYAAMVEAIDTALSRVISHLEASGDLDNTFILFMSDNGAEGALLEALPLMGPETSVNDIIAKYYDNSLENMGNKNSFVWYGPEWACASMAPSRGFKTWITEGGIRCPCIIRYPPAFPSPGGKTDSFCTVMDITPTILDLAGLLQHPAPTTFHGCPVAPIRGTSWVPHLSGVSPVFHNDPEEITGWELFSQRAIRKGAFKAIFQTVPRGNEEWELYNVEEDPGEMKNLAEKMPGKLKELVEAWERYYTETGMFIPSHEFGIVRYG